MRKYRSQPAADRARIIMDRFPKTMARLRSDGWDDTDQFLSAALRITVYESDAADHWQKLGLLDQRGNQIEYYAGPGTLGFLFRDDEDEE